MKIVDFLSTLNDTQLKELSLALNAEILKRAPKEQVEGFKGMAECFTQQPKVVKQPKAVKVASTTELRSLKAGMTFRFPKSKRLNTVVSVAGDVVTYLAANGMQYSTRKAVMVVEG